MIYNRILTLGLCSLLLSVGSLSAKDTRPPRVAITKVVKKKVQGGLTFFEFKVTASDNEKVRKIEYRVAVDGKDSGWVSYPYYEDFDNRLPFTVDCNTFSFQVRAVDTSRNKSQAVKKVYNGL